MVLKGNQKTFDQAQRPKGDNQNQWAPKRRVQPIGRLVFDLNPKREADDKRARKENDEHGRSVAGIGKCKIETAYFA